MIDVAFYNILSETTEITDLVGSNIFPQFCENPVPLYLVYAEISHDRRKNADYSPGKHSSMFQVDIYGEEISAVSELAEVVITELDGLANSDHGHNIQRFEIDAERSNYETSTKRFRKSLDFILFFD